MHLLGAEPVEGVEGVSAGIGSAAVMVWSPALSDRAARTSCFAEPRDASACGPLDDPADGEGSHHDGEVCFDRVALAVV